MIPLYFLALFYSSWSVINKEHLCTSYDADKVDQEMNETLRICY